jgi:thiol:disulfide interchange protein DsbD
MKTLIRGYGLTAAVLLLLCLLVVPCGSRENEQNQGESDWLKVKVLLSHETIRPGMSFRVALEATIKEGLHIHSHNPTDEFLVPTVVELGEQDGVLYSPVSYPKPVFRSFAFSKEKLSVYEGKTRFFTQGRIPDKTLPGVVMVSGILSYQACDDKACFMPTHVRFKAPLTVVGKNDDVKLADDSIFQEFTTLSKEERRAKAVIEKGLIYAVAAFFIFGLALNLTPCVYPVIPMTVAFFGGQGEAKKSRTFVLALYYVMGIAIVFSILGLISSLAGQQWGFMFQNPWFVIVVAMIILAMAASMFGAFEIRVPTFLMTYSGKSRKGGMGSFIMGLTVGVVIAPCAAGIIIGLIGVVAKLGIVAKGTLLFFVMGLGLGLPYLFLAMSSGLLTQLPKSGMWMVWIRKLFGILLIGVALYFLIPQGKQAHSQEGFYLGVLSIFGGLFLGFLDSSEGYGRIFKAVRVLVGLLLIIIGGFLVHQGLQTKKEVIDWVPYTNQSLAQLQQYNKPIIIDFYADWCGACRELDDKTFADVLVGATAKAFLMVRADFTAPDPSREALMKKFKVTGLPTIVFIGADGTVLRNLRVVGFLGPKGMLERMEAALSK